jgi:arylsulfatase A-like enzyme
VHWPKGIAGKGETRDQFHHVIDVAPTILEAAHIPAPTVVNSIQQAPLEGVSMTGHSSASIRILPAGVSSSREHQEQVALGDR